MISTGERLNNIGFYSYTQDYIYIQAQNAKKKG